MNLNISVNNGNNSLPFSFKIIESYIPSYSIEKFTYTGVVFIQSIPSNNNDNVSDTRFMSSLQQVLKDLQTKFNSAVLVNAPSNRNNNINNNSGYSSMSSSTLDTAPIRILLCLLMNSNGNYPILELGSLQQL